MRFIGSKTLLLENIKSVIDENAPNAKSFCDVFSGTSVVARYFKQWYEVYSNDLLYFSYVLQKGTIENDRVPVFENLIKVKGINDPIAYFNSLEDEILQTLKNERRFFQNTYAPNGGRMYMSNENALRIDYSRNKVEEWKNEGLISENEYFYLIACIVEGIPFISNISGTYGAFHKTWDKRAMKKYELFRLDVLSNGKNNKCFNIDGVELVSQMPGDILYIDPPYNERQYLPNYHVLETAAMYDYPEVRGVTAQRPNENKKSDFCLKGKVLGAFDKLIENAKYKHIIMSYNNEGLMKTEDIEFVMKKYGKADTYKLYEIPYRRYKSRNLTRTKELNELLFYIEKGE